jgi:hypothetical protein
VGIRKAEAEEGLLIWNAGTEKEYGGRARAGLEKEREKDKEERR